MTTQTIEIHREKKKRSRRKNSKELPAKWKPRFLDDLDHRQKIVTEIKRRIELLKDHSGADSYMKELLCERVAFLSVLLETAEFNGIDNGKIDIGSHVQACNALSGLLAKLGLDRQQLKEITNLNDYMEGKKKK